MLLHYATAETQTLGQRDPVRTPEKYDSHSAIKTDSQYSQSLDESPGNSSK